MRDDPKIEGKAARHWAPGALRRLFAARRFAAARRAARRQDWSAAVEAWRQGLEWRADAADAWLGLSEALEGQGRSKPARAALERAAELAGADFAEPYYRLALAHRIAGDFEAALGAFQEALRRDPHHEEAAIACEALAPVAARLARNRPQPKPEYRAPARQRAG